MTAEDFLMDRLHEVFGEYGETSQFEEVTDIMKEFAEYKCKELLEIVAEKAEVNVLNYNSYEVDKDSILNAVDLNSFIS